jgi:RNA polymerase sigma-70 factor (ECF subfamily)
LVDTVLLRDKLLVKELVEGNKKAFRNLYDIYRNDLYRFSLSMVFSKVYAEEIIQGVFLKLWINRKILNPELSIKSYLFTIVRNDTISFLKKAANNIKLREEIFYTAQKQVSSTDRYMREAELEIIKKKAFELLTPKRRQIFEMSRNEGKSYHEIAVELDISPNTVRNQMSRALETLRTFLLKNHDIGLVLLLLYGAWM